MKRVLIWGLFALSWCAVTLGALSAFGDVDPEQTLAVYLPNEPNQMDPLLMEDGTALRLAVNILGTPTFYDSAGNLQNALLKKAISLKNHQIYDLEFRSNLKWSDGVLFHADQFLLALKRLSQAKIKVALSELFPKIDFEKTKVLSSTKIRVVLSSPDALFLEWCSLPPFAPIREDIIKVYESGRFIVPTLGDYELVEARRTESMLLKAHQTNDSKIQFSNPSFSKILIRYIREEATLLPLMQAGKLDVVFKIPQLQYEAFKKHSQIIEAPIAAVTYLGLNTRRGYFSKKENRTRLAQILSVKERAQLANVLRTGEQASETYLPSVLWPKGFNGPVVAADKPVVQGVDSKFNQGQIKIQTDPGQRNSTIVEWVQSLIKEKVGQAVQIEVFEWKAHLSKLKTEPDDLFRLGWQNPVASPYVFYQVLLGSSTNNFTGFNNVSYNQKVAKLKVTADSKEVQKLTQEIETILRQEVPVIPLLQQQARVAYGKRVHSLRVNPFGVILFKELKSKD